MRLAVSVGTDADITDPENATDGSEGLGFPPHAFGRSLFTQLTAPPGTLCRNASSKALSNHEQTMMSYHEQPSCGDTLTPWGCGRVNVVCPHRPCYDIQSHSDLQVERLQNHGNIDQDPYN